MSAYELNDELVRRVVGGRTSAEEQDSLFRALEAQLPPAEPDREYLVVDERGDVWVWDVRQLAWSSGTRYLLWSTLIHELGPVRLYGEIR